MSDEPSWSSTTKQKQIILCFFVFTKKHAMGNKKRCHQFSLFLTLPPLTIGWSPSSPGPLSRPGAKLRPGSKVKVTLAFFGKTGPVSPSADQSESNAKHYKIKAWERSETNVNISKRPFMRYNLSSMSTKVCVKSGSYFKNFVCLSIRLLPSFLLVPTLY